MKILHGLTGSVATELIDKFHSRFLKEKLDWSTVVTESALHFVKREDTRRYIWKDENEWAAYKETQSVLHIDLVKQCDVFVIAPCSANTLAKIANGICDNLLTCCARAWDFKKPFIIAPAMNTQMYNHPVTLRHLDMIRYWGIEVIDPIEKELYCGDVGIGAMAHIDDIIKSIKEWE